MRAALAKVCIGHALGHLDSKFDLVEMCRNAGAKGGGSNPKNKAANVIGDWAKKVSCDNGGRTDKAMARQIAENIPPHLKTDAELLKDLEGVVYRAIRSL
jgi:hypothetical protein